MRYFILSITTESCDHYSYILSSEVTPLENDIEKFLKEEFPEEYEEADWRLEEKVPVDWSELNSYYEVANSTDWLLKYARDARWDILGDTLLKIEE